MAELPFWMMTDSHTHLPSTEGDTLVGRGLLESDVGAREGAGVTTPLGARAADFASERHRKRLVSDHKRKKYRNRR